MVSVSKYQAEAFVHQILGWEAVGVDGNGDEVTRPNSPLVRSHLEAALGDKCPNHMRDFRDGRGPALADYLRAVADAIDPPNA
jgi:hypothetical protein